jgi:hypothetical protein
VVLPIAIDHQMASPIDRFIRADRCGDPFFSMSRSFNVSRSLNLSRSLRVSVSFRVVPADNAACNRSPNSMTTSNVTGYPTDDSPLDAALRLRTRDRRQDQRRSDQHLHD